MNVPDASPSPPPVELPPITRRLGITPRMRALAECVPFGTRVFVDVGTNHCILPIAVLRDGRVQRCIAVDSSQAVVADARRRLRRAGLHARVDVCVGDGLLPIAGEDVDVVCVAGLGPRVVTSILEQGLAQLPAAPVRLVLNPFGGSAAPRAWLAANGFVLREDLEVAERGRSYTILVAERQA